MSRNRLFLEWLILLVGACALAAWSLQSGLTSRFDNRLHDWAMGYALPPPSDEILIATIDDSSLAAIGPWPWGRETHAQLIDQLSAAGAEQIIYDVLFVEETDPEADARLAEAMQNAGNVILPHSFGPSDGLGGAAVPLLPIAVLAQQAQALGHVAAEPDSDGVLRRFALTLSDGETSYPQMTAAAYAQNAPDGLAQLQNKASDDQDWAAIPFRPGMDFQTTPAAQILNGSTPRTLLEGKTVFVGATAQGMGDRYSVATGDVALMSGVETQANLLNALQTDSFVSRVSMGWAVFAACLALLLQFGAFWLLSARSSLIATVAIAVLVLAVTLALVPLWHVWAAPGSILVALILAYPLWNWRRLVAVSEFLETESLKLSDGMASQVEDSGFDVIARQVSRMRRLVSEVSGGLEFMHDVIDASPDPVIVLDKDGHVETWNSKASALFPGWGLSERPQFEELFLSEGVKLNSENAEVHTKDGKTYLLAKGPLAHSSSKGGGEVLALRDVTQARQQESERQEMLEFLSHDIRSPQVAIIGLANKSKGDIEEPDRLDRIEIQAKRALKLADDFVQLARLEQAPILREDADLVSVIQEACDRAYVTARKKKIKLTQTFSDEPFFAVVDASLIARIIDNLLGNAIKFSPSNSTVRVTLSQPSQLEAMIEVADQGPGLPPEREADPFARFGAHDSKAGPSVGLGLAFVEKAVKKHDGRIEVWSESGLGTTFRISLPLQP